MHAEVRRVGGSQEPFVAAGEAPTPPPAGFDDYSGGSRQSQGVIAMLEMIKEDIEKDIEKAKKQEKEAQEAQLLCSSAERLLAPGGVLAYLELDGSAAA